MSNINRGMVLPDPNHVVRHVPWNKLQRDEHDNVVGFLPQAFALRENEDGLSVNWIEHFEGCHEERIVKTIQEIRKAINVKPKSAFGVSKVGAIKQTCRNAPKAIKIVYWPNDNNVTHSLIRHLPMDDISLLDELSREAFNILIRNSDIT
jgi:hypothetical protein